MPGPELAQVRKAHQLAGEEQYGAIDHAVEARDDRGRVSRGKEQVRRGRGPAPVAEAGAEDLQQRGAEEDRREDAGARRAEDETGEKGQADRAQNVDPTGQQGQPRQAGDRPGRGQRERDTGHYAPVAEEERSSGGGEAEKVDEAVAGRDVKRDVVELVAVEAPDQRPEDLEAGRDHDKEPDLAALRRHR